MRMVLEKAGASVTCETIKNKAFDLLKQEAFDVTFFDPLPQNEIRPFIMGVRRTLGTFPPIIIMGSQITPLQAFSAGGNDLLKKPHEAGDILLKARNAARISAVSRLMADESEDFPSKDGLIAKSAFNQLFITCLDRADRHGEHSYLIFIDIDNLDEIAAKDGPEMAKKVADNLRRNISRTRRTSDIAGHIKTAQFCLLLLRPQREDEPFLAANRFAENLKENHDLISVSPTKAILKVWLLAIPTGDIPVEHMIGRDS
jgi:PleD family two-component response regulator